MMPTQHPTWRHMGVYWRPRPQYVSMSGAMRSVVRDGNPGRTSRGEGSWHMFRKVLVANRGEIAIRSFRAAYELGCQTVAVFPYEDRNSEHRLKANEAYQIGERGHPVRAYLDPVAIVETAVRAGADAVYPGYGFLSENPQL